MFPCYFLNSSLVANLRPRGSKTGGCPGSSGYRPRFGWTDSTLLYTFNIGEILLYLPLPSPSNLIIVVRIIKGIPGIICLIDTLFTLFDWYIAYFVWLIHCLLCLIDTLFALFYWYIVYFVWLIDCLLCLIVRLFPLFDW